MTRSRRSTSRDIRVRNLADSEIAMGPGKAELLEAIAATGSISAAAREMRMSYRRAWLLVQTMNECFAERLVESAKGGEHGGGASLTPAGAAALTAFHVACRQRSQAARESALALQPSFAGTRMVGQPWRLAWMVMS